MVHRRPRLAVSAVVLLGALVTAPAVSATGSAVVRTQSVSAQATTGYLEGVDVSHWQGTITWSKVAAAGKSFAMIKASESIDYVDPMYASNRSAAQTAGLWTGAYHFARPSATAGDAVAEADHFVASVKLGVHDLIPALDIEVTGGLGPAALTKWVTDWLNEVTARLGNKPMIYTSPSFWKTSLGDTRSLADAGYKTLWVAHWGVSAPTVPAQNWGGHGWTFWQYSNCGTVPGITGCVDLDRYNGTDLRAQAFSMFNLNASTPAQVKQGSSGTSTVGIIRTNFDSAVALSVSGLPAGGSATFNTSPTTTSTSALQIATDPATIATGTYPLTITGSGNGLTRTTQVTLTVVDGLPPTVTQPATRLLTGQTIGSTTPVRMTWSASDPSGISAYSLQRSINGGAWQGVALSSPTATSAIVAAPTKGTIQPRVRATDRMANTSAYVAGSKVQTGLVQQSSTSVIRYTGTWHTLYSSSASGGNLRYTTSVGASATFSTTAASIGVVGVRGPTRGSVRVYIDGTYLKTVSLRLASLRYRSVVFAINWAGNGTHTIKLVVASGRVDLDAFVTLRKT